MKMEKTKKFIKKVGWIELEFKIDIGVISQIMRFRGILVTLTIYGYFRNSQYSKVTLSG